MKYPNSELMSNSYLGSIDCSLYETIKEFSKIMGRFDSIRMCAYDGESDGKNTQREMEAGIGGTQPPY